MGSLSLKFKVLGLVLLFLSTIVFSQVMKEKTSYFDTFVFKDSNLGVKTQPLYLPNVMLQIPNRAEWQNFLKKYPNLEVYIDQYTGMPAIVNNISIPWVSGNPFSQIQWTSMDQKAKRFIKENWGIFQNLPLEYLVLNQQRSGPFGEDGYLWFVDYDFVYQGVPIEGARVVFRCNHSNLVQFGVEGIMPMNDAILKTLNPIPNIDNQMALDIAFNYAGGFNPKVDTIINEGQLKFIPRLKGTQGSQAFEYPLIWEVAFSRQGITGTWTAYIDAHTGEVLSFWDNNRYGGIVQGGVYPISPTVTSEVKRGFPYVNVASGYYTDSGGKYSSPTSGTITSTLNGKYVKISDSCGSISLSGTAPNNLDFGTSSGTDCTTPGVGGAGNTHASRSCFYHVTNAKVKAMKWLTSNTWLTGQLTANVNLNQTCNAYWNGSTLNFFKSGGGCANTGEIAAIFLHELGHGLDSNDGYSTTDYATGETYGDTHAALLTHSSCIGPGFFSSNCSGYGDSCTSCTGVRDIDYAKHSSGTAHTISNFVFSKCPTNSSYAGPCGKEGHCESYPLSEAMWDLAARDLPNMGLDSDTSWFVLDRLFYLSRSTSGSGYSCNTSTKTASGCSTSNWHQTFLVVDDNDGNLSNGTPHAQAIYNAFNRHGVACTTSTQTNSGCSAISAPSPTVTAGSESVSLSWSAVSGASKYYILRNDLGCSYGYIKIAETTSTSYTDTEVGNGLTYYYRVVAVGSSAACMSALSACKQATPSGGSSTYSISGTITYNSSGLSGVSVSCTGPVNTSSTTDTSGNYACTGLTNGTYTVTPTKSGYTFSPANQSVNVNGANVTGINFTATASSTDQQLTSGTPLTGQSVAKGEWKYYYITVPSGATSLEFKTTNSTGDVDLYTQYNAKPTSSSYACRPYTSSGDETCTHSNPSAGTWWAGVYGYAAGSYTITATVTTTTGSYTISGTIKDGSGVAVSSVTVNLTGAATKTTTTDSSGNYSFTGLANGSYTVTPSKSGCTFSPTSINVTISGGNQTGQNFTATCSSGDTQELSNGVPLSGQSVSQGQWKYYYITVPSGATSLEIKTTSATGDVDLYTQYNAKPTSSSYLCRPYTSSGNETCTHSNPSAGTWWAGVYGYAAGSYTITATYTTSSGCTTTTATYNSTYKTPACTSTACACEAPSSLLQCRDSIGPEPNQPNTINSSCADGTSGTCHSDESIESIKVATSDGSNFAVGKTVNITVTAYCYSTADRVTLFYSTSVSSPSWSKVGSTQTCSGSGYKTFTFSTTLSGSAGSTQAFRAQITYNVDPGTTNCYSGSYNDRDDLVIKLQ